MTAPTASTTVPHAVPHAHTPPVVTPTPGVVDGGGGGLGSSYHAAPGSDNANADNASSSSSSFASNVGNLITSVFVGNVLTVLFLSLLWQVLSVASPFLRPITWATFFAVALRVPKDALLSRLKKSLRKTNGLLHLCAMPFTSVYDLVVSSFGSTETNAGGEASERPASDAYFTWLKRAWVIYAVARISGAMPAAAITTLAVVAGTQAVAAWKHRGSSGGGSQDTTQAETASSTTTAATTTTTTPARNNARERVASPLGRRSPNKTTNTTPAAGAHRRHSSSEELATTPSKDIPSCAVKPKRQLTRSNTLTSLPVRLLGRAWTAFDSACCSTLSDASLLHTLASVVLLVGGAVLLSAVFSLYTTMVVRELRVTISVAQTAVAAQIRVGRNATAYATSKVLELGGKNATEINGTADGSTTEMFADLLTSLGSNQEVRQWLEYAQSHVDAMAARYNVSAPLLVELMERMGGAEGADDVAAADWLSLPPELVAALEQGRAAWAQVLMGDLKGAASTISAAVAGASALASEQLASFADLANVGIRVAFRMAFRMGFLANGVLAGSTKALVAIGSGVAGALLNVLTFFFTLFYFLSAKKTPIELLTDVLPLDDSERNAVGSALGESVRAVFVVVLKEAAFHGSFMLLLLMLLRAPLCFSASAGAAVLAAIPVVPPSVAAVPAVLMMEKGARAWGLAGVIVHYLIAMFADAAIQSESGQHYYLFALSVFGGMAAFSPAYEGAILGPLLVTGITFMLKLARMLTHAYEPTPSGAGSSVKVPPSTGLRERLQRVFPSPRVAMPRAGTPKPQPAWQS
ncbi:hypothetical protein PPROV_001116900 [Pycnococcus provasolii]|uniref:Transmembrane protein n=1 Tax=Pycnococcus provasolii TaxID=41880 RepID=A0A830I403_9CHLO|nr:hypothetical protein PPROV_001116900 [Pycnococcus provasolii]